MPTPVSTTPDHIFSRDARDPAIAVADGHGLRIHINRGHLVVEDGIGTHRRTRRFPRAERTLKRLVILGASGSLSLEVLRWCRDVDVAIVAIDPWKPSVLAIASPRTHHDARLRRAQALTIDTDLQLTMVKQLLDVKLAGQERIARDRFGDATAVESISRGRKELADATDVRRAMLCEANAAGAYFKAWVGMRVTFAKNDLSKIPNAWNGYGQRTSILTDNSSPRSATHPVNAVTNFLYALGETEAVMACHSLGLDPALGILHSDKAGRDSLALDLLETIRPDVDDYVIDLVQTHVFSRADLYESSSGQCRLLAPLTHELGETLPAWAERLAPHAEAVAHALVDASGGVPRKRRPLTGKPKTSARSRKSTGGPLRPEHRCPICGVPLEDQRRLCCVQCAQSQRQTLVHERLRLARERLRELQGRSPKPDSSIMRSAKASLNRAEAAVWEADHPGAPRDPEFFRTRVLPVLQALPISVIAEAIAVGGDAAWRIREGMLVPHPRHWDSLMQVGLPQGEPARPMNSSPRI